MDTPQERSRTLVRSANAVIALGLTVAAVSLFVWYWFVPQWRAIEIDKARAAGAHRTP